MFTFKAELMLIVFWGLDQYYLYSKKKTEEEEQETVY